MGAGSERRRAAGRLAAVSVALSLVASAPAMAAPAAFAGHLYEYVPCCYVWPEARAAAEARTIDGTPGYLATITSAAEEAFVVSLLPPPFTPAYVGGSDAATEGTWVWETGPEAGTTFWQGGAPVGGAYTDWLPGEPNDFQGEDHLSVYLRSTGETGWVDWEIPMGFIVEHSFDEVGFSFAMADGRLGALRNESPSGVRLVRVDVTLPSGTFFDTAETPPGVEFSPIGMLASSGGATAIVPDGAATDGLRTATISFTDFDPIDEIRLSADVDRLAAPDGGADVVGTAVTATFSNGAVVSGVVAARASTILGVSYPYSVRAVRLPDWDVDGVPDAADVCPGVPDPDQADRGGIGSGSPPDGIGDACQCGDVSGDGRVSVLDASLVQRALLQPPTAVLARPELCDASGDDACTVADAVVLRRALLQPPTAAIQPGCVPEGP